MIKKILSTLSTARYSIQSLLQYCWKYGEPEVPEVTVEQLIGLQKGDDCEAGAIVVDVRSPAEYQVSMIPGAITQQQYEEQRSEYADKLVIAYCTIGYRSGLFAFKLRKQGVDARNFKGSILAWCNAEQPLTTLDGKATNRVHTYSAKLRVPSSYTAVY